jgi:hypothetical protein
MLVLGNVEGTNVVAPLAGNFRDEGAGFTFAENEKVHG